jgi:hypothetical protein
MYRKILMRKLEGKRPPLRRPRYRWVDNIKMDIKTIGWENVDWFYLAKDRDQYTVMIMETNAQVLSE